MTLFRLAGFSAIRVTSQWLPGQVAPPESELGILRNVAAPPSSRASRSTSPSIPPGSRSTPLTPEAREEFAAYLTVLAQQLPVGRRRDRRQRAEPEPLLAAAVQPRRDRRSCAGVPRAARPLLRRAQGGRPDASRSGAARSRPAASTGPEPVATRIRRSPFLKDMGSRLPGERPDAADHGRARLPSLRRQLRPVARHAASEVDDDRPRRLRPADPDARDGVRRNGAGRDDAARPLRRVRRRVADPGRQGEGLHRRRAGDDEARRRDHPGAVLRAGAAARVLPAERDRNPPLPLPGRGGARELAVGRLLRRRDAEVEPLRRARRARAARAAARSPAATGSGSTSRRRRCASRRRQSSGAAHATCGSRARSTAPGSCAHRAQQDGGTPRAADRLRARRGAARRLAEGTQARSRAGSLLADPDPPGQPGRAADASRARTLSLR